MSQDYNGAQQGAMNQNCGVDNEFLVSIWLDDQFTSFVPLRKWS